MNILEQTTTMRRVYQGLGKNPNSFLKWIAAVEHLKDRWICHPNNHVRSKAAALNEQKP